MGFHHRPPRFRRLTQFIPCTYPQICTIIRRCVWATSVDAGKRVLRRCRLCETSLVVITVCFPSFLDLCLIADLLFADPIASAHIFRPRCIICVHHRRHLFVHGHFLVVGYCIMYHCCNTLYFSPTSSSATVNKQINNPLHIHACALPWFSSKRIAQTHPTPDSTTTRSISRHRQR